MTKMNVRAATNLRSLMLFFLFSCTGCAIPGMWYTPQGMGVLEPPKGTWNIRDTLCFDLGGEVRLFVRSEPSGNDTHIHMQLVIPEGSWVQLTSDKIQIIVYKTNLEQTFTIHQIESRLSKEHGADDKVHSPLDKLEGEQDYARNTKYKYVRNFYIRIPVENFKPSQFELKIPPLTVNGNVVDISPIKFSLRRGLILYQQIQ